MMCIVITGNPGVGKHTIAKEIAIKLEMTIIDINQIARNANLIHDSEVDVQKLKVILKDKISKQNILVGHLAPYVVEEAQASIVIVLRRNPYDLIPIYEKRKYSEKKIKENTGSEILGIIMHDAKIKFKEKTFQIDTSKRTIQETTDAVIKVIQKNDNSESVDWLELVRKNNDFARFFAD